MERAVALPRLKGSDAILSALMKVAQKEAESLRRRNEVIGVVLYGSVARGDVRVGSDVDIIVLLTQDVETPDRVEHGMRKKVAIDITFLNIAHLEKLLEYGDPQCLILERCFDELRRSGRVGKILYDPTGKVERIEELIVNKISTEEWRSSVARNSFQKGEEALLGGVEEFRSGNYGKSVIMAKRAGDLLALSTCQLSLSRELSQAVKQLGISGILEEYQWIIIGFFKIYPVTQKEAEKVYLESQEFLEYAISKTYTPLKKALTKQGVKKVEELVLSVEAQLEEEYRVVGRFLTDVSVNLKRAHFHLQEGRYRDCIELLPPDIEMWWKELPNGLERSGYKGREILDNFMASQEFQDRKEKIIRFKENIYAKKPSIEEAKSILSSTQNMRRSLEKLLHKEVTFPNHLRSAEGGNLKKGGKLK